MRRPGFGSAALRLLAVANAVVWLLSIPELVEVWGDAYTIPGELSLPRATIWVVAALLVFTACALVAGWRMRRRGPLPVALRRTDAVLALLNAVWAGAYLVSFVIAQVELRRDPFGAMFGGGGYVDLLLGSVSAVSAVLLARDALPSAEPAPARSAGVPRGGSAVLRLTVGVPLLAIAVYVVGYLAGWIHRTGSYSADYVDIPWGVVLVALTAAAGAVLLGLGWVWRPGGAPSSARAWLRIGGACEVVWALVTVVGFAESAGIYALRGAFWSADRRTVVVLTVVAIAAAVFHDRDARRLGESAPDVAGAGERVGPGSAVRAEAAEPATEALATESSPA